MQVSAGPHDGDSGQFCVVPLEVPDLISSKDHRGPAGLFPPGYLVSSSLGVLVFLGTLFLGEKLLLKRRGVDIGAPRWEGLCPPMSGRWAGC